MTNHISPAVYQAAHQDAIVVERSQLGMLKFTGESRLDLLDRMSTNQVNGLAGGAGTATILTTDIGRMIDRLLLYAASDSVYCLTGENNGDPIARYLMRFVFFNDDFHIDDLSRETAIFGVYGPAAAEKLASGGFPTESLPLHHWRQVPLSGLTAYLHRTDPINEGGFFVMCEHKDREALLDYLPGLSLAAAAPADFEYLRIEAGWPLFGHEISQSYIPLEANLWDDVSFSKGCYIGQEVIARMESRGKLAKRLVRLRLSELVAPGTAVTAQGKNAGTITSVAAGGAEVVALGYLKMAVLAAGTDLMAGEAEVALVETTDISA